MNLLRPNVSEEAGAIRAMYYQMKANGQFYVGQLGGMTITIDEWQVKALERLNDRQLVRVCD